MKRYIKKIALFFAIVVGVDLGVGFLGDYLQAHANRGFSKRTNDLVMKDLHDVVILGSSRAHHHYDTPFLSDTLGLDVYNAGYDGNGVVLAYGLLSMMLERYSPRLVIFDVEPAFDINVYENDNGHKRYLKYLKPYYRNENVRGVFRDVSEEEWYKVHSGLIRYNSSLVSMLSDCMRTKEDDLMKGYDPLEGIYTNEPDKKDAQAAEIDSFKLEYVEKMIQTAQSKHVSIVFVGSPKYGSSSSDALKSVKDICALYHIPFLDYYCDNTFMQHKEWFKEPMHLNREGAKMFSTIIVNDINNIRN